MYLTIKQLKIRMIKYLLITITQKLKGEILKKVGGRKFKTYQSPFLFEKHKRNNKFNFIGKLYVDIYILKS